MRGLRRVIMNNASAALMESFSFNLCSGVDVLDLSDNNINNASIDFASMKSIRALYLKNSFKNATVQNQLGYV